MCVYFKPMYTTHVHGWITVDTCTALARLNVLLLLYVYIYIAYRSEPREMISVKQMKAVTQDKERYDVQRGKGYY
jgi:hypothetical protein